jgi:hypothetical protein
MYRRILACFILILSFESSATDAIYCTEGQVDYIQSQQGEVVAKISGVGWMKLGAYGDAALPVRVSMALSAQASGKTLTVAYPLGSGVVCGVDNWSVSPVKVKITK